MAKTYLQFGIPSDFSDMLQEAKISIEDFKKYSQTVLKKKCTLDSDQINFVKVCLKREPISDLVVSKLLKKNNSTCCLCKGMKSDAFIIHHIKMYSTSQDNRYENLALLCPNDHDLAHREGISLTRKITVEQIKQAKKDWEKEVAEHNRKAAKTPRNKKQWSEVATKLANFLEDHLFGVHRGALLFDINTTAVFGNDGYEVGDLENKAKNEVLKLRDILKRKKLKELGFGLSDDKYSWCLLVDTKNVHYLNEVIWDCFPAGGSNNPFQKDKGILSLYSYFENPLSRYLL